MVVVKFNINGQHSFQKQLKRLPDDVNKKCQQALNRTLQRSRTKMTNAIGEKLNLRKKTIRDLISLQRANKNTGLIGKLTVKHKHVPLIEYNAKQNLKGVSFKVFKDRPRQLVKHAFIYNDKSSRLLVFKREPGAQRLKIKPLYGTTVSYVLKDNIGTIKLFIMSFLKNEVKRIIAL